jgi:hypothetical protein
MNLLYILATFVLLVLLCTSFALEAQVNVDGEIVNDVDSDEQYSLSVSFQNTLKEKVKIHHSFEQITT